MNYNDPNSYYGNQQRLPYAQQYQYEQPVSGQVAQAMPYANVAMSAFQDLQELNQAPQEFTDVNQYSIDEPPVFQDQVNPYAERMGFSTFAEEIGSTAMQGGQFGPKGALIGAGLGFLKGGFKLMQQNRNRKKWQEGQRKAKNRFKEARGNYWQERSRKDLELAKEGFRARQYNFR